jgi:hypothetical protein
VKAEMTRTNVTAAFSARFLIRWAPCAETACRARDISFPPRRDAGGRQLVVPPPRPPQFVCLAAALPVERDQFQRFEPTQRCRWAVWQWRCDSRERFRPTGDSPLYNPRRLCGHHPRYPPRRV